MWIERLLEGVKGRARWTQLKEHRGYLVGSAVFDYDAFSWVLGQVEDKLKKDGREGEKIFSKLGPGKIVDRGIESLEVEGGFLIEYYDYPSMTVIFIRLYLLEGEKSKWLALYIDENPETPWWSEEERGGEHT